MLDTVYYNRDGITLHCGDNCEVMRTMPSESIDLVVTSPPYDDLRQYGGHSWDFYGVAWNLKRLLKPGGVIVWVVNDKTEDGDESGSSFRQALHFKAIGLRLHDTMIYRKENPPPLNHPRYEQEFEYAFVFSNGKPRVFNGITTDCAHAGGVSGGTRRNNSGDKLERAHGAGIPVKERKILGNIWQYSVGKGNTTSDSIAFNHPAIFPEDLAHDHILSWSNEDDTVLDPFSGSGTTIKMARETGRKGIGIEVNKDYCDIAVRRLQQRILFPATEVVSE